MDTTDTARVVTAAQLLQWSHDLSAMDTGGCGGAQQGDVRRFNGAMTFQPWILGQPFVEGIAQGMASMEP